MEVVDSSFVLTVAHIEGISCYARTVGIDQFGELRSAHLGNRE